MKPTIPVPILSEIGLKYYAALSRYMSGPLTIDEASDMQFGLQQGSEWIKERLDATAIPEIIYDSAYNLYRQLVSLIDELDDYMTENVEKEEPEPSDDDLMEIAMSGMDLDDN